MSEGVSGDRFVLRDEAMAEADRLALEVESLRKALAEMAARAERAEGDVIERIVVCVDTDELHEELDAWAGDRMAATRILRNHVTRALAARGE